MPHIEFPADKVGTGFGSVGIKPISISSLEGRTEVSGLEISRYGERETPEEIGWIRTETEKLLKKYIERRRTVSLCILQSNLYALLNPNPDMQTWSVGKPETLKTSKPSEMSEISASETGTLRKGQKKDCIVSIAVLKSGRR